MNKRLAIAIAAIAVLGAAAFLTKPVDRAELCVRVRNQLRLKAYSDDVQRYSEMLEGEVAARTSDLRTERDRAQRYLDTAGVILLALDLDGRIALVNRYACSVLGWTAGELLGRDWIETCLPARRRDSPAGARGPAAARSFFPSRGPVLSLALGP